ncbi:MULTISPECIES: DNA polymerase IV [Vagococcus]|uniref:DNA polymerase IV n=1 Tax=Vagococcus fluvialis bH819 TaxID=1255619 RepID=A0A1X6WS94_9ENTE|nr:MULTISPECIES: DNA polymerase IV [Vagococcus]SLM87155.1 DNA polymerase IV [Vagococcus fluvialis bH819]HCM90032.1 DNA polymerase IV [Vagococcus sp.]
MSNQLRFPLKKDTSRKIIHIDMDAFFASVEERDHPELVGHPLVIARHPKETGGKGVVTTANYEARKFGIHSAMSAQKAYELCPKANFVQGNRNHYAEISKEIHKIFHEYTDMIEPLSLDEAYLDVTTNKKNIKSAIKIARMIQLDIWQKLHLTCSAGVSYNKFLAKIASDFDKPKGLTLILPDDAEEFVRKLPIEDFHGVGKKTVPKMHELGIYTGDDLYKMDEMELIRLFGKMGYSLYRKVRGIHDAPVEPHRDRKSVGRENTYGKSLATEEAVIMQLRSLSFDVEKALKRVQLHGKTIVLKIRDSEFETYTRRVTLPDYLDDQETLFFHSKQIWDSFDLLDKGIRLLGITVTNLESKEYELIKLPLWEKKI